MYKQLRIFVLIACLSLAYTTAYSQVDENVFRVDRSKVTGVDVTEIMDVQLDFNSDWRFYLGEIPGFHVPEYNDSDWRVLQKCYNLSLFNYFFPVFRKALEINFHALRIVV